MRAAGQQHPALHERGSRALAPPSLSPCSLLQPLLQHDTEFPGVLPYLLDRRRPPVLPILTPARVGARNAPVPVLQINEQYPVFDHHNDIDLRSEEHTSELQ